MCGLECRLDQPLFVGRTSGEVLVPYRPWSLLALLGYLGLALWEALGASPLSPLPTWRSARPPPANQPRPELPREMTAVYSRLCVISLPFRFLATGYILV